MGFLQMQIMLIKILKTICKQFTLENKIAFKIKILT